MASRLAMRPGAVHAVPVDDRHCAGVQRLTAEVCAVHEPVVLPLAEASLDVLMRAPNLFEVMIANSAFKPRGGWRFLGLPELPRGEPINPHVFVHTDIVSGRLSEYVLGSDANMGPDAPELTIAEAERLEDAAVWDGVHIEWRLKARVEGREEGFLATMLRPWQAAQRRARVLSGLEPKRPPGGFVLDRIPEWG